MKKLTSSSSVFTPALSLLSVALFAGLYSPAAYADLAAQCLAGVPHFKGELVQGDQTKQPIYIEADDAVINQPRDAEYSGQVSLKQGNRNILSDKIYVSQEDNKANFAQLRGAFDYQDNLIQLKGNNANLDFARHVGDFQAADYQFVGRQGRGTADHVQLNDDVRILKNASFTSCLPNNNAWAIDASEIKQHVKEEYAEMWHARFKILGIPVFYTPYMQLPTSDRRRSGLLIPELGHSSRDGYYYIQPFYWNIVPNFDATLATGYLSRRGWLLRPEFRYLTQLGTGRFAGEYIGSDRLPEWNSNKSRWLFHWNHEANFAQDWHLSADITRVSDKRYFTDFDSPYGSSSDGYATQAFKLGYYQPNYNLSISGKHFQTFDDTGIKPYYTLPKIEGNYYRDNLFNLGDFTLSGQIAHFNNSSKSMPSARRFHLEPKFNIPLANRFGSLNIETKLYATHYAQKSGSGTDAEQVQSSVTRVLPQLKVDLKTVLANSNSLLSGYSQTLEPHAQYLYRPYRNQSQIGARNSSNYLGLGYDSVLMQQDYYSLFNDRYFSGLDRIASANQITLGATTRFFKDSTGEERFNLSLGQRYYLTPSRIDDQGVNVTGNTGRSSAWSLESNLKLGKNWRWRGSYQYDTRVKGTSMANTSLEYRTDEDHFAQLNYRYASKDYIDQNLSASNSNRYNQSIKQIGGVVGWQVNDNVSVMASHYRDLAIRKPVESQMAINYDTCCWRAKVYVARKLVATPNNATSDTINDVFYDNRIGLNFELNGLGSSYRSSAQTMTKKGLIPYTNPFSLN